MAKIFVESKRNNRNEFQFLRYEFSYKFTTKIRYEFFQSIFRKDERFDLEKRERVREEFRSAGLRNGVVCWGRFFTNRCARQPVREK